MEKFKIRRYWFLLTVPVIVLLIGRDIYQGNYSHAAANLAICVFSASMGYVIRKRSFL